MADTCKIAQVEAARQQTRYKKIYDRKARVRSYKPGEYVLILLPTDHNKLLLQWKGPFKVVEVVSPYDHKIETKSGHKIFHANMLKRYIFRSTQQLGGSSVYSPNVVAETLGEEMSDMSVDGDSAPDRSTKNLVNPKLTTDQMNELAALLEEYADVFSDKPGSMNLVEHKISLISEDPICFKPYPVPFAVRDTIKDEIQEMLNLGVIEHSDSPYAAPVVLIPKRDGSTRFCIDYRRLNKLTVFDPEPMNQHHDIFIKICSPN